MSWTWSPPSLPTGGCVASGEHAVPRGQTPLAGTASGGPFFIRQTEDEGPDEERREGCDWKWVRLIPKRFPLTVGPEDSQVGELIRVVVQPGRARLLEAGLQHMAMATLDHARANG